MWQLTLMSLSVAVIAAAMVADTFLQVRRLTIHSPETAVTHDPPAAPEPRTAFAPDPTPEGDEPDDPNERDKGFKPRYQW